MSPRIATAPVVLTVRARVAPDSVRGPVCIVVDGAEAHSSCWNAEEMPAPMVVRRFTLEHAGEYAVQMFGEQAHRQSNVASVVLD